VKLIDKELQSGCAKHITEVSILVTARK